MVAVAVVVGAVVPVAAVVVDVVVVVDLVLVVVVVRVVDKNYSLDGCMCFSSCPGKRNTDGWYGGYIFPGGRYTEEHRDYDFDSIVFGMCVV